MSIGFVLGAATLFLWLVLAFVMWTYRPPRPLWPTSFWFALSGLAWSLGELGTEFASPDAEIHWRWLLLLYAGVLFSAPLWWSLVLRVSALHRSRPRWASTLVERAPLALALLCYLALLTNPWHAQFLEPVWDGRNHYGPIWYFQAAYGYALMMASLGVTSRAFLQKAKGARSRKQAAMLFAASLAPVVANFLYITRIVDSQMDPTVAAFGFGVVVGLIGIARERLFGMSGLSFDLWIDHETDGVAIIDEKGTLVRANPALQAMFAHLGADLVPEGDFLGVLARSLEDDERVEGPSFASRLEARLRAQPQPVGGHLFRGSITRQGLPAAPCWLRITATPIPARWPSSGGLGLRLRDETQLQETSERAARQAVSIEAILGSMRDGLLVVDQNGRLLYANERFWEMWRLPHVIPLHADEATLLAELAFRSQSPSALSALAAAERVPESDEGLELALKSGQVFAIAISPLTRRDQRIGRVWTFRDISGRRQAELERARIEERIRESQKLESLGVLAGGIAHDFNNILVGILGNVDLAAAAVAPASQAHRHLLGVKSASDRAAELIQQLLAYAGRGQVSNRVLDLSSLVRETQELVQSAVSKKARFEPMLAPDLFVRVDPVQLRQIVMNLLTNASDALGDGSGVITIRTGLQRLQDASHEADSANTASSGGEFAFLEIKDTGCGMDSSTIERIFDPFFTTKKSGRGLGLSAVLGITRAHGGFLRVRSAPGKGSSFVLYLPRVAAPLHAAVERTIVDATPTPATPGTILVVDDEEVVRDVARAALEMEGYRVMVARDGQEGLALFREHRSRIAAIVLDMTMPRMDGAEALFAIRQIGREVPVVLSSGYSEQDTMARCAGLCAVGFIHKPYTPERLIAKVNEAVQAANRTVPTRKVAEAKRSSTEEPPKPTPLYRP